MYAGARPASLVRYRSCHEPRRGITPCTSLLTGAIDGLRLSVARLSVARSIHVNDLVLAHQLPAIYHPVVPCGFYLSSLRTLGLQELTE